MIRLPRLAALSLFLLLVSQVGVAAEVRSDGNTLVPFDVGKAGSSASLDVHVSRLTKNYPREVALMVSSRVEWRGNPKGDELREKYNQFIESLAGYPAYEGPYVPRKPHKGIKVKVVWSEKQSGKVLQEREVIRDYPHGRVRAGPGTAFSLDGMLLSPGDYVVTVTAIDDDPRFDGEFKTGICAGYTWK